MRIDANNVYPGQEAGAGERERERGARQRNAATKPTRIPVRVHATAGPARASGVEPSVPGASQEDLPVREQATGSSEEWRDRALRLQAEMDNFRKRQQRMAQEQARADQERLIHDVLAIADNLDRTLDAAREDTPIRRGVALTRAELARILSRYEVERITAHGQPFDPAWHEAVDVVSARSLGVDSGTVVREVRPGYRRGERLLRPARVVVAQ
jgi:molecular chaperone GrpE